MRLARVKVYAFKELDDKVQAKLIERELQCRSEMGDTSREVKERFKERLPEFGYPTERIYFSLGHCQGDGMCFEGTITDEGKLLLRKRLGFDGRKLPAPLLHDVSITVKHTGSHYYHYNTMEVEWEWYGYPHELTEAREARIEQFVEAIREDVKDTSRTLEREGYDVIEGEEDEEYIRSYLAENDEEYFSDGDIFWGEVTPEEADRITGQQRLDV